MPVFSSALYVACRYSRLAAVNSATCSRDLSASCCANHAVSLLTVSSLDTELTADEAADAEL